MYSGGKASWLAAHLVKERFGDSDEIILLFTDTKTEDKDLYRFLHEGAEALGLPLVILSDGRDIWQLFKDTRFLGNNRVPVCSRVLKSQASKEWVAENLDPETDVIHFGIDWTEQHRTERIAKNWEPYSVDFPLIWEDTNKSDADRLLAEHGIKQPRLYDLGFPHNNCGGGCVRAGQGHFKHLLMTLPETYMEWEKNEEEIRQYLEKDVSILRDRRGGESKPMTLRDFRLRVLSEDFESLDLDEWGGCSCMADEGMEDVKVDFLRNN
jgi:hypothetical protein